MNSQLNTPNADEVRATIDERLRALEESKGFQETVSIEWRGQPRSLQVISMPVDMLSYNPATHRVRAQRSLDPERERQLDAEPYSRVAQDYLHDLLTGDPADPSKRDPAFEALKEDLHAHGQNDPGVITRTGVLVNGNTRRAALKELGYEHIRVGVLPPDASFTDLQSIELSLQLRKDYKRDYSYMNFLLAIDERIELGRPATEIQRDFRVKASTFERAKWILKFVRDAIERSTVSVGTSSVGLRLIDFEEHQGKLEELYRAYTALKKSDPDEAEALREQRLLAIVLGKSKTDVRWIEPNFAERYMKQLLPDVQEPRDAPTVKIPGTNITARGTAPKVAALKELTTRVLQNQAIGLNAAHVPPEASAAAAQSLAAVDEVLEDALEKAGKTGRVVKKRLAPADRLIDASEDLEQCLLAVSEARATNNFDPTDVDEPLLRLKGNLLKLAQLVTRASRDIESTPSDDSLDGVSWLTAVAKIP